MGIYTSQASQYATSFYDFDSLNNNNSNSSPKTTSLSDSIGSIGGSITDSYVKDSILATPTKEQLSDLNKKVEASKPKKNKNNYKGPFAISSANDSEVGAENYIDSSNSLEGKISSRESTLEINGRANVDIVDWNYKDFINERANWVKGTKSLTDGPAWFYFKIFFKFNTAFGLLGGVLGANPNETTDTAAKYFSRICKNEKNSPTRYIDVNIPARYAMLQRFVKTLSYISCCAPWFFSKVNDVNSGLTTDFNNLTKEKSITIECLEESIDMKLTTMMDLYKFCAFDDINQREILPENLRKFDMDILVFETPLRYIHTSMISLVQDVEKYKGTTGNLKDIMSYKLFTFKNCEFDYNSLNSMLPQSFTNDSPFKSIPQIKINYERVYQHNYNEFANLMFGSGGTGGDMQNPDYTFTTKTGTGINYNKYYRNGRMSNFSDENGNGAEGAIDEVTVIGNGVSSNMSKRAKMLKYLHNHPNYYNPNSTVYKALVDASEENLSAAMRMIDNNTAFGNLYWSGDIGDMLKNTGKNVLNNFKEMGQSLAGKLGIKL